MCLYAILWWKSICKCGFIIRAKETRDYYFSEFIDNDRESNDPAYIYCERENGNGHVYKGTWGTCDKGNGFTAKKWVEKGATITTYKRYRYYYS